MLTARSFLLFVLASILLYGCAVISPKFQVNDTTGLRAAYLEIYRSYQLASEIEGRADIPEAKRQELRRTYDEARAQVNSFLESTKAQAAGYVVDVPTKTYLDDDAHKTLGKFLFDARGSLKVMQQGIDYVFLASKIIDLVVGLHDSAEKEAHNRFIKLIDENKMKSWERAVKDIAEK